MTPDAGKTRAQIQREVEEHLKRIRALEAEASTGSMTAANTGITYDRLSADRGSEHPHRWIGACKQCGTPHAVEGRLLHGHARGRGGHVIRATDGRLLTTSAQGTDPSVTWVPCGDHRATLHRVREGTKKSKHACGARCTHATGPNCDCRCRGENHGRNLPS